MLALQNDPATSNFISIRSDLIRIQTRGAPVPPPAPLAALHLAHIAHPAHALLSVAHALLGPASTIATAKQEQQKQPIEVSKTTSDNAATKKATSNVNVAHKTDEQDPSLLPIEQPYMSEDDVSDLRDVVDAINKLCATMKTSYDEYEDCEDAQDDDVDNICTELVNPNEVLFEKIHVVDKWCDTEPSVSSPELTVVPVETCVDTNYTVTEPVVKTPEVMKPLTFETCKTYRLSESANEPVITEPTEQIVAESIPQKVEAYSWSETVPLASEPVFEKVRCYKSEGDAIELQKPVASTSIEVARNIVTERFEEMEPITLDVETVQCDPMSEMYYTASSEVSLLSDVDFQDKVQTEDSDKEKDDRNSVMTGHVAAMRERFESMTRNNTPCPDLIRSTSPSFEVFRNVSASPDKLE
ncbi:jg9294 [Pararge aegeria aegeria]|uniref:Jg9294 protein n=1 Tax=Pararge aegeria aegeria TaxID=348720 RepID=A0A8S4SFV5_9NEOP|nr:jg9294 [Pararge aegeria aegeria]